MDASRLRQEILVCFDELVRLKDELITRRPMARGTVYELKRKCGKGTCRCMRGQLHRQMCIAITRKGKKGLRPLKGEELRRLEKLTDFHRRFRKTRAQFIKLSKEIVSLANQLEEEMIKKGKVCPSRPTKGGRE